MHQVFLGYFEARKGRDKKHLNFQHNSLPLWKERDGKRHLEHDRKITLLNLLMTKKNDSQT